MGGGRRMKIIKLNDIQFNEIKEFIDKKCESIVERSLDWGDSSFGEELIKVNEPLFELKAILEEVE
jgi:hypothetical protein